LNLVDWLRQYSAEKDETFIRGFLGRMLFSGEESLKKCTVLIRWRKSALHDEQNHVRRSQLFNLR
jgi:hypothetical protein